MRCVAFAAFQLNQNQHRKLKIDIAGCGVVPVREEKGGRIMDCASVGDARPRITPDVMRRERYSSPGHQVRVVRVQSSALSDRDNH
jgi:hypothetical protein